MLRSSVPVPREDGCGARIAYPPNSLGKGFNRSGRRSRTALGPTSIPLASCPGLWGGFQRTVSFRFLLAPSPCACRTGWPYTCCNSRTPSVPSGLPVSPAGSWGRSWAAPHTLGWSIQTLSSRPSG